MFRTTKGPICAIGLIAGLFALSACLGSCQPAGDATWDNPIDPVGSNYHLPTVSFRTSQDTTFIDSSLVQLQVVTGSKNSQVVSLAWVVDGSYAGEFPATDGSGSFHPSGLKEGKHFASVGARDSNGLSSNTQASLSFRIHNAAPVLAHVRDTGIGGSKTLVVQLSATDSDGTVAKYLFDTTGGRWDSSTTAPTLAISSSIETTRKIHWCARDNFGKTAFDSFAVRFSLDRPVPTPHRDDTISASQQLSVSVVANPLDTSIVTQYLWSTDSGATWDSASTGRFILSRPQGGNLSVIWKARNSLGRLSKSDTFMASFIPPPTNLKMMVDSNLVDWNGSTGSLVFRWSGSVADFPQETITWTLYVGKDGNLSPLYCGIETKDSLPEIDSNENIGYKVEGKNRFGDIYAATGHVSTTYIPQPITSYEIPWNRNIVFGRLIDRRDAQIYFTVKIGSQTWMAQNLNFKNASNQADTVGICFNFSADSCNKYGRLYSWSEVMDVLSSYDSNSLSLSQAKPHQGICPNGWHVPNGLEWNTLTSNIGGVSTGGNLLKSSSGWKDLDNGTDAYGFRILPSGNYSDNQFFSGDPGLVFFWTSDEYDDKKARDQYLVYQHTSVNYGNDQKSARFSLRCIQD